METSEQNDATCAYVQTDLSTRHVIEQYTSSETYQTFAKRKKDIENSSSKKIKLTNLVEESFNCGSSGICSSVYSQKSKGIVEMESTDEVRSITYDGNVHVLNSSTPEDQLTAAHIENIMRHVTTNEYVLSMVQNAAETESNDVENFKPNLTRSKVKQLKEKLHMFSWPMEIPMRESKSKIKTLLEEEYSDDSSSDVDYDPQKEIEFHMTVAETQNFSEDQSSDEISSVEDYTTNDKKEQNEKKVEADSLESGSLLCDILKKHIFFVTNLDDHVDKSTVQSKSDPNPDESVQYKCELKIQDASVQNEILGIAVRTRSKLSLYDISLETIEASFVAPDAPSDIYSIDVNDPEWLKFLEGLSQPLDEKIEEDSDDPEYNAIEDDSMLEESEYFENNMSFAREELISLVTEIYSENQSVFNSVEDENFEEPNVADTSVSKGNNLQTDRTGWRMTLEERLQLEQQMRKHIQVITQSYLLSFGIPELNYINISSKLFLDEIKLFASSRGSGDKKSAFYTYNLDSALDIVNEFENNRHIYHVKSSMVSSNKVFKGIPNERVKDTLFNNRVFLYPELLPTCGFYKNVVENKKIVFTSAEDNLIALGLEEFSLLKSPVYYIHLFLVPIKSEEQIKVRIKNSRNSKSSLENPIKYYFLHKKTPPFPRAIELFDPEKAKAPKDCPAEILPRWMRPMFSSPAITGVIPILPKAQKQSTPSRLIKQSPPKRKIQKILPRNIQFSPLKQLSPILKKYSHKRFVPAPATKKDKTSQCAKMPVFKPPLILPKPAESAKTLTTENTTEDKDANTDINSSAGNEHLETSAVADSEKASTDACDVSRNEIGKGSKNSEGGVDLNGNECDSAVDDADEEVIDDEPETSIQHDSSSTNNLSTKKHSVKKKNKHQRDLESSLALLQPNLIEDDPKREEREDLFVNSYVLRVNEVLKEDIDASEKFLKILGKYQQDGLNAVKVYLELKEILKNYPALADDFIAFLNHEEAKECGKYKEYVILSKIRSFIRKIEVHFKNQPQHLLKISKTMSQFTQHKSVTSVEFLSSLQPLLKNQSHLIDELTQLLPEMAPSENLMIDFEDMLLPNSDDDNSSVGSCEEIQIPDTPDPYGGKDCPCECHTLSNEIKVQNKIRHCMKCGVKFIDGKIFIQTGKVLKPAQVVYSQVPPEPVKINTNSDLKTAAKVKHPNTSSAKSSVTADQSTKSESSHIKKDVKPPALSQTSSVTDDAVSSKDPVKTPSYIENTAVLSKEAAESTTKLPCDIIENTVFPVIPNKKNVPPDSSHSKNVIVSTKDGHQNVNLLVDNRAVTDTAVDTNKLPPAVNEIHAWTREEDKLIIYNCQRFGVTQKAFEVSSSILKSKTKEEVQRRIMYLLNLFSQELNVQ